MHGYYATAELHATALEQAELDPNERITCLKINLSPHSHCVADLICYYFGHLAANTPATGAKLIFETMPAVEPVQLLEIDITMLGASATEIEDY